MKFHHTPDSNQLLRLVSLGGFGRVTSNMFVYECGPDILLVDCGMGFPSDDMLGVDILIPDISYLRPKLGKIRGLVLTHGHEDHTGALPYILPQLGDIPIYASKLTANLVMDKLAEYENMPKQVNVLEPGQLLKLGAFTVESVHISHSIPDATNLIIQTPVGTVYHGSDFKFDFTPVDGRLPDLGRIAAAGNAGVHLLLSDCLGSERSGHTPSEKSLEDMFEREIGHNPGRVFITSMSSNISRWHQAVKTALRHGRKIAISGRSIERNVKVAARLGYFDFPSSAFVPLKDARKISPSKICVLIAGSQAQPRSALVRLSEQDHRDLTVQSGDKIIFSSDYIPGNETAVQSLIDSLARLGATVIYSGLTDDLHVSGHGSRHDLSLMAALTRPQFLLPIGGTYRHMVQYSYLAQDMGYKSDKILLPEFNQTVEVTPQQVRLGPTLEIKNVMVDGLGVGDVGHVVLRDRQHLAEEGIVVAVAEVDQNNLAQIFNLELISRGFVFDKQHTDLFTQASAAVKKSISQKGPRLDSDRHVRQIIIDVLEEFLFQRTHRRPMVLPIVVKV